MKEITFHFNRDQWALPIFVAWLTADTVKSVAVHILCFSIHWERWGR